MERHFTKSPNAPKKKIIVIHGHSDGLNPFLDTFDQKEMVESSWYCVTVAVDITKDGEGWKVEDEAKILPKKPMIAKSQKKPEIVLDSSPEGLEKIK